MSAPSQAAVPQRRAALLVHALPATDREWLLNSLAPHHRVEMELLLDELRGLGISPDAEMLGELVETPAQAVAPDAAARLERLTPAQAEMLVGVLRAEPPQVAAVLLGTRDWSWKASVAQALGGVEARPVHAPALQRTVCEVVLRRVEAAASAQPIRVRRWNHLPPLRWKGIGR